MLGKKTKAKPAPRGGKPIKSGSLGSGASIAGSIKDAAGKIKSGQLGTGIKPGGKFGGKATRGGKSPAPKTKR